MLRVIAHNCTIVPTLAAEIRHLHDNMKCFTGCTCFCQETVSFKNLHSHVWVCAPKVKCQMIIEDSDLHGFHACLFSVSTFENESKKGQTNGWDENTPFYRLILGDTWLYKARQLAATW